MQTVSNNRTDGRIDRGFTLVEIVIVVVILGIIAAVVAFSVRSVTERGETSACGADARTLTQSAEVYMAQAQVDEVPAMGSSSDRHELFLVDRGFLKQVSTKYDLQEDGTVVTNGQPCT